MGIINPHDPLLVSRAVLPRAIEGAIRQRVPDTTQTVAAKLRRYDPARLGKARDCKRWRVHHNVKGSVLQVKGGALRLPSTVLVIERNADGDVTKVIAAMPRMRHLPKAEQSRLIRFASDAILAYCGVEVIPLPPPVVPPERDPLKPEPRRFLFRPVDGPSTVGTVAEDGFGPGSVLVWKDGIC